MHVYHVNYIINKTVYMHFDTAMYSFPIICNVTNVLENCSLRYVHLVTYITKIIIFYYTQHNYVRT